MSLDKFGPDLAKAAAQLCYDKVVSTSLKVSPEVEDINLDAEGADFGSDRAVFEQASHTVTVGEAPLRVGKDGDQVGLRAAEPELVDEMIDERLGHVEPPRPAPTSGMNGRRRIGGGTPPALPAARGRLTVAGLTSLV
jgi:hypothetical protein